MTVEESFQSFGEELRQARLAKGRSLDEIASSTKIHRRHLEAIEAGDPSRLPQGPYVKAFVREYARAVGLVIPEAFAIPTSGPARSVKDPKVVSRPAPTTSTPKDTGSHDDYGLPAVARETARKANTAVKSAVKSVTKTTGSVVNLVEASSKEALEVLTSKSLWDEAEAVRRERLGLPPIERPVETRAIGTPDPTKRTPRRESNPVGDPDSIVGPVSEATTAPGHLKSVRRFSVASAFSTSKRTTNLVIGLLALLFAGAIYFAIRMSHTQSSSVPTADYVPAPIDKPQPLPKPERPATTPVQIAPAAANAVTGDSLSFQLRAMQPVWVSISPDGIPTYRGELKAGEVRIFRARGKFVINIGNQKSVEMQFNGQRLSNLPAVQNSSVVVRDLVLMRDRVTLGGTTLDLKKITNLPMHSQKSVAVIPPAVSKPPIPPAKGVPSKVSKSVAQMPAPKLKVPQHGSVAAQPKTPTPHQAPAKRDQAPAKRAAKQPKQPKKTAPPPAEIHVVEPIPPRL